MPPPKSSPWPKLSPGAVAALVLIAAPLLFFFPTLFEHKTFFLIDISCFHYPSRVFWARMVSAGQWPLWNPYICCGFPMHAEGQISVFYPFNASFLLPMRPTLALSWYVGSHFWLAGLGAFALGRRLGLSHSGSLLAALAFAFSGYMTAQLTNLNICTGSAWLPVALLLAWRATGRGGMFASIGLGGALGVQILGSHPQTCLYTWLTVAGFTLWRLWATRRDGHVVTRLGASMLLPFALAAGLAAVQILPTWELKQYSPRANALDYAKLTEYSLAPRQLLALALPSWLGNPRIGYLGAYDFFETFTYVGALPLLLSFIGLVAARGKASAFWRVLAGASLALALGSHTPLYRLVAHVPVLNLFRAPARWLLTLTLSLAMLAGGGWDALGRLAERRRRWTLHALGAVALALGSALLAVWLAHATDAFGFAAAVDGLSTRWADPGLAARLPESVVAQTLHRIAATSLTLGILWAAAGLALILRQVLSLRWAAPAAVGLVLVDLGIVGAWNLPLADSDYFHTCLPLARRLERDIGQHRICPPNTGDIVAWLRENTPTLVGIQSVKGHPGQIVPSRYQRILDAAAGSPPLLDLMSVKYLLRTPARRCADRIAAAAQPQVVTRAAPLPRAFVADAVVSAANEEEAWDFVSGRTRHSPRAVVVECAADAQGARGEAKLVCHAPHEVELAARTDRRGLLFLSDMWQPGWRAYVNGKRERIVCADYSFRGVVVPAGQSVTRMAYAPKSFALGAAVSLLCIAGVVGLMCARAVAAKR